MIATEAAGPETGEPVDITIDPLAPLRLPRIVHAGACPLSSEAGTGNPQI
jgi:hypothetical protein